MHCQSGTATQIRGQQIRLLFAQSPTAVMVGLSVALLTAYHLRPYAQESMLLVWAVLMVATSLFRFIVFRLFTSRNPPDGKLNHWLCWHVVSSAVGGMAWGTLGLLYDPDWATIQQVVTLVVISGAAVASMSAYSAVMVSYLAFLLPLLLPLTLHFFIIENPGSDFLGLVVLIFGVGLYGMARKFNERLVDTLGLAEEQKALREAVISRTQRLHKTERALRTTEQRFGQIMESSLDGVWDWDIANDGLYFSPRWKSQLGFADDELPNEFAAWESRLHPDDREETLTKLEVYLEKPWGLWEEEFRLLHKDGTYRWIFARATPTLDDKGGLARLTGVHIDVTDRVQAESKIQFLAYHDWLTQLPNRLLLIDRLGHALAHARRAGSEVFILFIDLDHFKHINDSLGHPAGDSILRKVADRIVAIVREEDTVARLGGDEFAVLIEHNGEAPGAAVVAEKLLANLSEPFIEEGHRFYVGASIGISVYPGDGDEPATLLKNADAAMYQAKNTGRNRFHFYTSELTNTAYKHIKLEYGLRQALQQNQFQVYYQPKICLRTGRILGAEALLRWRHPEEGFISPAEFIPVAEDSGLIMEIGEWVLREACRQAAGWRELGLEFEHIAVNISGVQLQHAEFVRLVETILVSSALPAASLELELTENFLMRDAEASARLLEELRRLGVGIAIDDFGTGYSSLAYLTRFPVNKLKIDRSFITKVCKDAQNAEISRTIIGLGHTLKMKVVAEGIELERQLEFLKNEGCDEGQGYAIARPLPHDEFVAFLNCHDSRRNELLPNVSLLPTMGSSGTR